MAWRLHHVTLPAFDVDQSREYFSSLFGMVDRGMPVKDNDRGVFKHDSQTVAWFENEDSMLHLYKPGLSMARDNQMYVNPVLYGHIAIQVDDLDAVKARMDEAGHYYEEPGHWAINSHYQIYTYDPGMNVVEINQTVASRRP